jgi:beta-carotene 3-hydroxylase
MACTLALVGGGVFGMEMWARWAHKALWHDFEPGWSLHKSHHEPRVGPFEVRRLLREAGTPSGGMGQARR